MAVKTFASIDIGSYELELKIFEISPKSGIREIDDIRHRLDLGKDTFRIGHISAELLDELCDVLRDFMKIISGYHVSAYRAVATSAVREASNHINILDQIRQKVGIEVKVLSNSQQRLLGYKAIASKEADFTRIIENATAIVDLGGGSLQLSLYDKDSFVTTKSISWGFVRIREALANLAGSASNESTLVEELIDVDIKGFKRIYLPSKKVQNIIAVGDYINYIMRKARKSQNQSFVTKEEFLSLYDQLENKNNEQISAMLEMPYENAGFVIPSAIVYKKLIEELGAELIFTPGITIGDGLVYDYADTKKLIPISHDFDEDIIASAWNIGKHYKTDKDHVRAVESYAEMIFDKTHKIHGLGSRERLLLRLAVLLHDCGKFVDLRNTAQCSYEIILFTEIIGISREERGIIANVVRCQMIPFQEIHRLSETLDKKTYLLVEKLASIFRIANALDASHRQKIEKIKMDIHDEKLMVLVTSMADMTMEKSMFRSNIELFQEVFGMTVELKVRKNV